MREETTESDTETDDEEKPRFSLPPITFPPIRIPRLNFARIPFSLPYPRRPRGVGSYVLAGVAIDSLDIIAHMLGYQEVARVVFGTLLCIIVFGPIGLIYAWETVPLLLNRSSVTLIPTALLLAITIRWAVRKSSS